MLCWLLPDATQSLCSQTWCHKLDPSLLYYDLMNCVFTAQVLDLVVELLSVNNYTHLTTDNYSKDDVTISNNTVQKYKFRTKDWASQLLLSFDFKLEILQFTHRVESIQFKCALSLMMTWLCRMGVAASCVRSYYYSQYCENTIHLIFSAFIKYRSVGLT